MTTASRFQPWPGLVLAAALLWAAAPASAGAGEYYRAVDGMSIYVGVLPAEMIKGHDLVHEDRPRADVRDAHLVVALFDQASGERIEDANVSARLRHDAHTGPERRLESMEIAGTITYGNYFSLPEEGAYSIQLRIARPGTEGVTQTEFRHEHFAR